MLVQRMALPAQDQEWARVPQLDTVTSVGGEELYSGERRPLDLGR